MVGQRLRIFHAKSTEQDFRIRIRHIVPILIRIKEQVGHIKHVDSTLAKCHARHQIQTVHKIFDLVSPAVSILVFENRDLVGTAWAMGRRGGTRS